MKNTKSVAVRNFFRRIFCMPVIRVSYMNIYQQGYYHRDGKPTTLNVHPGDLYDTHEAAIADIDPAGPYIATVRFEWEAPKWVVAHNANSTPIPISATRKSFYQHMNN